ncbi:MAG: DUF1858 domain-containing protein [Oscillospiraceae bacterium]|nr:DUF1858 domain-containing protein [Oscillospiraceae bacterium]
MFVITKDTVIADILEEAPETAPLFISIGMHCLGCAASSDETVEEACAVHDVDVSEFVEALNARVGVSKE